MHDQQSRRTPLQRPKQAVDLFLQRNSQEGALGRAAEQDSAGGSTGKSKNLCSNHAEAASASEQRSNAQGGGEGGAGGGESEGEEEAAHAELVAEIENDRRLEIIMPHVGAGTSSASTGPKNTTLSRSHGIVHLPELSGRRQVPWATASAADTHHYYQQEQQQYVGRSQYDNRPTYQYRYNTEDSPEEGDDAETVLTGSLANLNKSLPVPSHTQQQFAGIGAGTAELLPPSGPPLSTATIPSATITTRKKHGESMKPINSGVHDTRSTAATAPSAPLAPLEDLDVVNFDTKSYTQVFRDSLEDLLGGDGGEGEGGQMLEGPTEGYEEALHAPKDGSGSDVADAEGYADADADSTLQNVFYASDVNFESAKSAARAVVGVGDGGGAIIGGSRDDAEEVQGDVEDVDLKALYTSTEAAQEYRRRHHCQNIKAARDYHFAIHDCAASGGDNDNSDNGDVDDCWEHKAADDKNPAVSDGNDSGDDGSPLELVKMWIGDAALDKAKGKPTTTFPSTGGGGDSCDDDETEAIDDTVPLSGSTTTTIAAGSYFNYHVQYSTAPVTRNAAVLISTDPQTIIAHPSASITAAGNNSGGSRSSSSGPTDRPSSSAPRLEQPQFAQNSVALPPSSSPARSQSFPTAHIHSSVCSTATTSTSTAATAAAPAVANLRPFAPVGTSQSTPPSRKGSGSSSNNPFRDEFLPLQAPNRVDPAEALQEIERLRRNNQSLLMPCERNRPSDYNLKISSTLHK